MIKIGWARLSQTASRAAKGVVSLMFAGVFVVFVYKIVMRYAVGDAVAWADEVCVIFAGGDRLHSLLVAGAHAGALAAARRRLFLFWIIRGRGHRSIFC